MGRPSKSEKRDQQLNLKFTLRELAWIRARAETTGLRPVDYARRELLADRPARKDAPEASDHLDTLFLLQLSRLGNNLNQIARKLHQFGGPLPSGLESLLADIRKTIARGTRDGA
jgi:hypothetical protein